MASVMKLYAAFLFFGFKFVAACPDGYCRELAFPQIFFFAHKHLVNHAVQILQVDDFDMCQLRCYQDPNCVSINFNVNKDSWRRHKCAMNNATHISHNNDLKDKTDYVYHGTINACDQAHCENGGTCQSGFTDQGYRCLCPLGFTSAHCEQDIDECSTGKHNCSLAAVCNNTIGSYNCTCKYKDGYVGDGRNCSSGCPKDWAVHDKYCYKLTNNRPQTLEDARKKCQEMFADLPIIKSKQQNAFIGSLMSKEKPFVRLGMRRNNSQLLWFDGISAEKSNNKRYNAWNLGIEINEPTGENCSYLFLDSFNVPKWNDDHCDYQPGVAPFVLCQKSRL